MWARFNWCHQKRISAHAWCLVCDWWTRLSACHRDVSWHCAILARKLHQVNKAWTVFWNAQNVLSWMYNVLMCCHWWSLMSRTWCTNAAVVGIEYHWRSQGQECVSIAYCASAIRSYCQNTSRSLFLLSVWMQLLEHPQTRDGYWVVPKRTEGILRRVWGERPRELNWSLWSLYCPTIYYRMWLCLSEGVIPLVDKVCSFAQPRGHETCKRNK